MYSILTEKKLGMRQILVAVSWLYYSAAANISIWYDSI